MKESSGDKVQKALSDLEAMDRPALTKRWTEVFGCPVPRHIQVGLLRSSLAWHCQMEHQAGSSAGGVDRLIRSLRRSAAATAPSSAVAPGTRLLREWQGKTHHITVLAQGFEYGGKTYRSLTAISRQITGMAWSGPLFFGLRT